MVQPLTLLLGFLQSESQLSAAFNELHHRAGKLEPVLKPTRAMLELKGKAFAAGPDEEKLVVHVHSGVDIARKDIRTLRSRQWLNDEVMNVYMGLLQVSICLHCICLHCICLHCICLHSSCLCIQLKLHSPECPVSCCLCQCNLISRQQFGSASAAVLANVVCATTLSLTRQPMLYKSGSSGSLHTLLMTAFLPNMR